jgi:CheY-like chemotaxis protein
MLPDMSGFVVTERLRGLPDPAVVLLVSTREASDFGNRLANSGAQGFISKADLSAASLKLALG